MESPEDPGRFSAVSDIMTGPKTGAGSPEADSDLMLGPNSGVKVKWGKVNRQGENR